MTDINRLNTPTDNEKQVKHSKILLDIELDGLPPTVNQMYRTASKTHIRYKTKTTREYQAYVVNKIREVYIAEPYTGSVAVTVLFLTSDKRRWDIDNRLKVLLDCLQMAKLIADDKQVDKISLERQREQSVIKTLLQVRLNNH